MEIFKRAHGLQLKLWIGVGGILLLGLVLLQVNSLRIIKQDAADDLLEDARALRAVLMASRRVYHQQFLDSGLPLTDQTLGLLPAHTLSLISEDFKDRFQTGLSFNNVSADARNPNNRADAVEVEAIEYFEEHPDEDERLIEYIDKDGRSFFHYAEPIWTEGYCLICHGDKETAPEAISQRYNNAFGYKEGELRGILSIKLPTEQVDQRIRRYWIYTMGSQAVILIALLGTGGFLLQRIVIDRLSQLRAGVLALGRGHADTRVSLKGRDEIAELAHSFNRMASSIATRGRQLKESELSYAYLAQHDPLTGLPNRVLFADRLGQTIRSAHRDQGLLAVLLIDLDRFKHINDSFDHGVGDAILKEVAARFSEMIREDDTLARMGGDEFAMILPRIREPQDAALVAHKVLDLLTRPFVINGHNLFLSASIGISIGPEHGDTVDDLMRNADAALFLAKGEGRKTFRYYSQDLTTKAFERVLLESNLHRALELDQLRLYYQPQFKIDSGALCGLEALVRWDHPEIGLIPPLKFIPLAEDSGIIVPMGDWILREACRQMKLWQDLGLVAADSLICVNLSARQFDQGDLVNRVEAILLETGLAAANLELEVTESAVMRSAQRAIRVFLRLRELGVQIAIDDFGTGYCSLSYLKRLPFTKLKIDQSFVSDIPDDLNDIAITKAIIAMARSLSMEVLAEGIEIPEQQVFLKAEGCDIGQGYLFSRPLPAEEMETFLASQPP